MTFVIVLLGVFVVLGMLKDHLQGYTYLVLGFVITAYVIYAYAHPQ